MNAGNEMMDHYLEEIEALTEAGFELDGNQKTEFALYLQLICETSQSYNITGFKQPSEIV